MIDPETIEKIKELAKTKTTKAIAEELDLPYQAVRWQIRKLGLKTRAPNTRSRADTLAIMAYYENYGLEMTMSHYGMSEDAVRAFVRRNKIQTKKRTDSYSTGLITGMRWKAFRYAGGCGLQEHAEDFASFVVVNMMRGKFINLDWQATNYKRQTFGDTNNADGAAKAHGEKYSKSVSHTGDIDEENIGHEIEVPGPGREQLMGILEDLKLEGIERAVFVLYYAWGLNQDELGFAFGVTGSRISQILITAHKIIDRRLARDGLDSTD